MTPVSMLDALRAWGDGNIDRFGTSVTASRAENAVDALPSRERPRSVAAVASRAR